jgi:hypothetical protein
MGIVTFLRNVGVFIFQNSGKSKGKEVRPKTIREGPERE